jgi:hypothetical protein
MADSGKAAAATSVARQSRRNHHTTRIASSAPSYSNSIEPWKFSATGCALSITGVSTTSGWAACSWPTAARTPRATSTSPAPLVRKISNPTTGRPSWVATERGSATVSSTVATWSSRMWRPSASGMSRRASSAAVFTVAMVRTDCSAPLTSPRPPGASCCTSRSRRDTSSAATRRAAILSASSSIRTSRLTPPMRFTAPTPGTLSSRLATVLSTNQLRAWSSRRVARPLDTGAAAAVKVITTRPAVDAFVTEGSRTSAGKSARTRATASRTSLTASAMGFSRMNSTVTVTSPSSTLV